MFTVFCQFDAKSGAIDQVTLGDRPVDRDRRVGRPCLKPILTWVNYMLP